MLVDRDRQRCSFNIAGNYVLIYGNFGAPALGVQGSGIASALRLRLFVLRHADASFLIAPSFRKYHLLHRFWRPDWAKFAEMFRLGVPMGISMIFEAMLFNAATLMMGIFGAASIAAHQIALNVGSVTFMVPLGIGIGGDGARRSLRPAPRTRRACAARATPPSSSARASCCSAPW